MPKYEEIKQLIIYSIIKFKLELTDQEAEESLQNVKRIKEKFIQVYNKYLS